VPLTLSSSVVVRRLLLSGCRVFAACSPPGRAYSVLRNDAETVIVDSPVSQNAWGEMLVNGQQHGQGTATGQEPDRFDVLAQFPVAPVALPDGGVDVTDVLVDIIRRIPDGGSFQPHSDRRQNASVIHFPTLDGTRPYVLTRTIGLPGTRSILLAASAPFGARIELRPDPILRDFPPAFVSHAGRRAHGFENLVFHRGGVELEGLTVGPTAFRSCVFTGIPGFAVRTVSDTVVGVSISNCQFVETDRGVGVLHRACDNWLIAENTTFVRLAGVGVEIHSSGVTVRDARFEDRQPFTFGEHAGAEPYIRVESAPDEPDRTGEFTGGKSEINSCRFGGEVGVEFRAPRPAPAAPPKRLPGPPPFAIEVGPSEVGQRIIGLRIVGNWFFGRTQEGGPNAESAVGAIRLNEHLVDSVVTGNFFAPYYGPLIVEKQKPDSGALNHPNLFLGNILPQGANRASVFSRGGLNWQAVPDLSESS
jgi:hypothetical protein